MERVEELTKDKVRLVEEYEAKLAKAQEYYERELEAMRRTHQLTTENLLAWKRTEVKAYSSPFYDREEEKQKPHFKY